MVEEEREDHIPNTDPLLGPGLLQYVHLVHTVVDQVLWGEGALRVSATAEESNALVFELKSLLEQRGIVEEVEESSGIPKRRILLRRDLASKSSHLLSNLIRSAGRCSTLA